MRDEQYFRGLNERLAEEASELGVTGYLPLVCECGDPHCFRLIRATPAEFEELRTAADRYAIFPGHEDVEHEQLLGATGRYTLVEKL